MVNMERCIIFPKSFDAVSLSKQGILAFGDTTRFTYDLTVTSFFQPLFFPHAVKNV